MTPEEILLQFLANSLPQALIAKTSAMTALVVAVVTLTLRYLPVLRANKRWAAPVLCMALGQIGGFAAVGFDLSQAGVAMGAGFLIGVSAIGTHSGAKNMVQAATEKGSKANKAA